MKKNLLLIVAALAFGLVAGCSVIAGKEDVEELTPPPFHFNFVETFRNEKSLQGESLRELPNGKNASLPIFQLPAGVYADQFRVYVTDASLPGGVYIFDRGDRTAQALNITVPASSREGKLLAPSGIAVDTAGIIYVSDSQQGRVFAYDRKGNLLLTIGRANGLDSKSGLGELAAPGGIAIDNIQNRIYVADTQAHEVKVFSTLGIHLFDFGDGFGNPAQNIKFPVAIALDRARNVYVLDGLRLAVFVFTAEGRFLHSFSLRRAVPGQSIRPKGIAVDSDGHVYVVDAVNNNVLVFNPDGSLIVSWGRTGSLNGDFWTPTGIFIDGQDYIYIADQTNRRVQTFQYVK